MLSLAAFIGSSPVASLSAGAASWLLGLTLLVVGRPTTRAAWPWAIPTWLGVATLAGLPLTVGFSSRAILYEGMGRQPVWSLIGVFFAEAFLVGALIRHCLATETSPAPRGLLNGIGYAAAASLVMALVLILGINPALAAMPVRPPLSPSAWIGWGAPIAGAVVLTLWSKPVRTRLGDLGRIMSQLFATERWYSTLLPLMRLSARLGHVASDTWHGDGAFLWMLLLLVLVLYLRRSIG